MIIDCRLLVGLATSLSFGHKNKRRKKKKKEKEKKESRKDRLATLVHPIEATFKFFYSPDNIFLLSSVFLFQYPVLMTKR